MYYLISAHGDGHESGHVHFAADQVESHNMEIQVKNINESTIDVHLGFLKVHHHYEVAFCIHDSLGIAVDTDPLQNVHVSIQQIQPTENCKYFQTCGNLSVMVLLLIFALFHYDYILYSCSLLERIYNRS